MSPCVSDDFPIGKDGQVSSGGCSAVVPELSGVGERAYLRFRVHTVREPWDI